MELHVSGHPLHTRVLRVDLVRGIDGLLDARSYLIDLRKRGFVPVGGDLQGPGLIHDMRIEGAIDPGTRTLVAIAARQPAVAFEPSAVTSGESCRDPLWRVEALAGSCLDHGFAKRLREKIGGPFGCSHILTLAQLLGSSAAWALRHEGLCDPTRWQPGDRVFSRTVIADGSEPREGWLEIAVQLTELHFNPAPPVARPMDRFGFQVEVRVIAAIEMATITVTDVRAAERKRTRADLESATWRDRAAVLRPIAGASIFREFSAAALRALADRQPGAPLLDAVLMIAPVFIQCAGALSERWPALFQNHPSVVGAGGIVDSCYMWRRDGALGRLRAAEGPPPHLR